MSLQTTPSESDDDTGRRLSIEIWADIGCPFCYLGKHRLRAAVAASPHAASINLRVRSFELAPQLQREPRPTVDVVVEMVGVPRAQAEAMDGQMATTARSEGLGYLVERPMANSFDIHRLVKLADTEGLSFEFFTRVQDALFAEAANVFDHDYLADAGEAVGLSRPRVEQVLASDEYADAVRADQAEARELGVTGVPVTVFAGKTAISGGASEAAYAEAIEKAWAEA
jgi:predicted DsbA family dithiol-disulfide isomerase